MGRIQIVHFNPNMELSLVGYDYGTGKHKKGWKLKEFDLMRTSQDTIKEYIMFQLEGFNHLTPGIYKVTLMKNRGDNDDWESLSKINWQRYSSTVEIDLMDIRAYLQGNQ